MTSFDAMQGITTGQAPLIYQPRETRARERQEQADEAGMAPVEGMAPAQVAAYSQYLNTTLGHIDSLRYPPGGLPRLQADPVEKSGVADDGSLLQRSGSTAGSGSAGAVKKDLEFYRAFATERGHGIGADGKPVPLTDEQAQVLATGLSRYDPAVLGRLREMGMKINIYDHTKAPQGGFPGGGPDGVLGEKDTWKENVNAYYQRDSKTICLRRDQVTSARGKDAFNTITHETAHAIDDMLKADVPESSRGDLLSFEDKKLKKLYQDYMDRTSKPHQGGVNPLWSDYAQTDASEYLAEGMMKYTAGGSDRESLKKADPGLYGYVKEKLARSEGPLPAFVPPPPPTRQETHRFRENYTLPGEFNGALLVGSTDEAKKLLKEFPDYIKKGSFGAFHPLHAAAFGQKPKEMIEFLIASGMDINAKDESGKTILQVAREAGLSTLEQMLLAHGAR